MLNNFCVSKCDFAKGIDFSAQLVKAFFSLCLPNIAAKHFYLILLKKGSSDTFIYFVFLKLPQFKIFINVF